jgi:hypothetical protein
MRAGLAAMALCAALALVTGCGGDVVSFDNLAGAAVRTEQAGSARVSFEGSVTLNHDHAQRVTFVGEGVMDWSTSSLSMRGEYTFPPEVQEVLGPDTTFQMIMDGRNGLVMYMRFSFLEKELPKGKTWMKADFQKLGKAEGLDLDQELQAQGSDPSQMLEYIKSVADVEKVGSDLVRREVTTHYHAEVDMRKVVEQAPATRRAATKKLVDKLARRFRESTYPMEIWVGQDGLVHKVEITLEYVEPGTGSAEMTISQELYDFGVETYIEPPPAARVFDVTELAARSS